MITEKLDFSINERCGFTIINVLYCYFGVFMLTIQVPFGGTEFKRGRNIEGIDKSNNS